MRSSHRYQRWRAGILRNEPLCRACAEVGYPLAADHRSITVGHEFGMGADIAAGGVPGHCTHLQWDRKAPAATG